MVALASLSNQAITEIVVKDSATAALDRATAAFDRLTQAEGRAADTSEKGEQTRARSIKGLENSARSFENLRKSVDPVYAAQVRLADTEARLNGFVQRGIASRSEADDVLRRYKASVEAQSAAMHGLDINQGQVIHSGRAIIDMVLAGQSPFRALTVEGTKLAQGFGLLSALFNPVSIGIGAIAAGFGVVAIHAADLESQTRKFNVALKATGDIAGTTGAQLTELRGRLFAEGASKDQATATLNEIIRSRAVAGAAIGNVASLSLNVAAGLGVEPQEAAKRLTAIFVEGYPAIKKFDEEVGFLTAVQLSNIRAMYEHGNAAGGLSETVSRLNERFHNLARESLSDAGKALTDLGAAWDRLLDRAAKSPAVVGALKALASALSIAAGPNAAEELNARQAELAAAQDRLENMRVALSKGAARSRDVELAQAAVNDLKANVEKLQAARTPAEVFGPPAALAAVSPQESRSRKFVDEEAEAQRKLAAAMALPAAQREIAIAKLNAQKEALEKNLDATSAHRLEQVRVAEAQAKISQGIDDQTRALSLNTRQTLAVADAYLRSAAAGAQADAIRQASNESLRDGVDVATRARQILAEQSAQAAEAGAKQVEGLQREATQQERVAEAAGQGAAAKSAAALQNKIESATINESIALQNADAETRKRLTEVIDQKTAAIKRINAAEREGAVREALKAQQDQLAISQKELELIGQAPEIRAREVAVLRQRLEIERQFPGISAKQRDELIGLADQQGRINGQIEEAKRAQGLFDDAVKNAAQSIDRDLTSSIEKAFNGESVGKWSDFVTKAINKISAQIIELGVIRPAIGAGLDALGLGGASRALGYSGAGANGSGAGLGGGLLGLLFGSGGSKSDPAIDADHFGRTAARSFTDQTDSAFDKSSEGLFGVITKGASYLGNVLSDAWKGLGSLLSQLVSALSGGGGASALSGAGGLLSGIGGLFGAGDAFANASGAFGAAGDVFGFIPFFHSGGVVGAGGGYSRSVPLSAFAGARRYHTGGFPGLGGDEVPAILQRGEEVLTRNDPRHRANSGGGGGGMVINIDARGAEIGVETKVRKVVREELAPQIINAAIEGAVAKTLAAANQGGRASRALGRRQ